jgi:hypothetical protein
MNHNRSLRLGIALILILLMAGCAPAKAESPLPTNTPVPPSAAPTLLPSPVLEEWDLLIISDSSNWGMGQYYAKLIESDMNVKVNLHDCWVATLATLRTLQTLQNGGTWSSNVSDENCQKPLTDLVKEAEVMVLFGNPIGSNSPSGLDTCVAGGYSGKNQSTGFELYKETLLASCSPENWATYKTNLGLLIDEIFKIREGRPLILRMTDFYIPAHSEWTQYGVDEVCTACISAFSEAIRQVAEAHSVPVADTMVGFNGKDYMSDPVDAGYIGPDRMHISDAGAQYIATLLQQTGYEYAGK